MTERVKTYDELVAAVIEAKDKEIAAVALALEAKDHTIEAINTNLKQMSFLSVLEGVEQEPFADRLAFIQESISAKFDPDVLPTTLFKDELQNDETSSHYTKGGIMKMSNLHIRHLAHGRNKLVAISRSA